MDRVKLIATLYNVQLAKLELTGVSKGSPSPYPFYHLPWLADKLGIDTNVLMLWFLRLCADRFLALIESEDKHALEFRVKQLSNKLSCQFNKDITDCIVSAMMLSYLIMQEQPANCRIPELTTISLGTVLQSLRFICIDERAHYVRTLIKEDWDAQNRREGHPWKAIARLKRTSIDLAYNQFLEQNNIFKSDVERMAKLVFGSFALRDGFNIGTGIVYITSAWESARLYTKDMQQLAISIHASIDKTTIVGQKANVEHLYSFGYDADLLAKQAVDN